MPRNLLFFQIAISEFQAWADAFKNQPDLQGVVQVYNDLKTKGVEFPAADLESLAPIITPKRVRIILRILPNFHIRFRDRRNFFSIM